MRYQQYVCCLCVTRCTAVQVRHVLPNDDKELKDGNGHPLPPFIVMERGEGLDVWLGRARTDRALAFGVRYPPPLIPPPQFHA